MLPALALALGDVVRIDPASGKVTKRINIGARVFNLASAPGVVWAVANLTSTVSRIDARSGRVTATVRVGNAPYDVEWGFGSAWVSNSSDGTVSRITGKQVVQTIKVGVEPNGLSAIDGFLWVADHTAGKLLRVDLFSLLFSSIVFLTRIRGNSSHRLIPRASSLARMKATGWAFSDSDRRR